MGCNCGDNEYNITVNNNGNCEPTIPIYNITLANVGVNGYSPIVRFVNETVESFNIAVDNVTGTETSPAVPKLSYVADQINDVYTTIAGLGSTYLTKDGSNATLPFSVGNLTLYSNGTTISGSVNASGYIATGEIRPHNSSGITIGYDNYDAPINIVTANKAYYNSNEIATLNDMPTVGNGTIAIMMNGAIRGSFKVNQSNNTILDLGSTSNYTAGNGIDITSNVISVDEDDLSFLKNTATGTASLTILGNPSDEPNTINIGNGTYANYAGSVVIGYGALSNGYNNVAIGISAKCKYGGDNNIAIGADAYVGDDNSSVNNAYQIGTGTNLTSNSLAVGYRDDNLTTHNYQLLDLVTGKIPAARIPIDGTTITVNNNGQLQSAGGSSYTAGTGIDITNDTISVDSTILTTNTAQTVTGDKTFSADIHLNGGNIELDATSSYIRGKVGGNVYRNIIARSIGASEIVIGNQGDKLKLAGSLPYPKYNNVDMALLTDIPIVNNSTITFTQGGVTKGTITLNQSSNATIALDAGGSGGGAVDSVNGQTGTVVLTASDVGALPSSTVIPTKTSDLTNDSGFITNSALSGYATETWVGQQGYITGITSSDVTTALGYTPYNSSNPNGYITLSALSDYVNKTTDQTVTGVIAFSNGIQTYEINNPDGDNLLSNLNNNTSVGDINSTINLYGNTTRPKYYDSQYNTPVDLALSSDIPTVNNPTITFTQGGTTKGTITLNQSSNQTIALDAGGGGATIDDTTPSTTTVYSSRKTQDLIDTKQNTLTAGSNIQINGNTISATNTTYSAMTVSEGTTGTATTARTMRADRLKSIIQGTKLTGLDTNYYTPITANDNILGALGKLQVGVDDANSMYHYVADNFIPDAPLTQYWENIGIDFVEGVGEIDSASILSSNTNDGWCNGQLPEIQSTNLINDYWEWGGMFRFAYISSEVETIAMDGVNNGGFVFYIQPNGDITNPDDNNKVLANVYFYDWVRFTIIHQAGDTNITVTLDNAQGGKTTTTTALATTSPQLINNVSWRLNVSPKIDYIVGTDCYFRTEAGGTKYFFTQKHIGVDNTAFDGQWVSSYQEAIGTTAQTINAQSSKSITFTNLPAKNCEVLFTISQSTSYDLGIYSDLVGGTTNRALNKGCISMILPVSSNKTIKVQNLGSSTASITAVRMYGYRVLGTNTNT